MDLVTVMDQRVGFRPHPAPLARGVIFPDGVAKFLLVVNLIILEKAMEVALSVGELIGIRGGGDVVDGM